MINEVPDTNGGIYRVQHRPRRAAANPAHTREVKLGWVFTQKGWDEEGYCAWRPQAHGRSNVGTEGVKLTVYTNQAVGFDTYSTVRTERLSSPFDLTA